MQSVSNNVREFLRICGISENVIAQCKGDTRLYHDLGIYGDVAEACMNVLVDHYQVDLSDFEFEKYFLPEYPGRNLVTRIFFWAIPFSKKLIEHREDLLPLTLDMIDQLIITKRWLK